MEAVRFKLFRLPEEADRQLSKEEQEQAKDHNYNGAD
jgi:hypothetical protein